MLFRSSKSEEQLYVLLCDKFGCNDVVRQYCSDEYQFACDFYIKSRNLYIELNAYYMHGGCWFNDTNELHVNKVNEWKDSQSQQYSSAIDTWTKRDVAKRLAASQYNLNYIVFWSNALLDVNLWFAMDCPDGTDWKCEYSWLPVQIGRASCRERV